MSRETIASNRHFWDDAFGRLGSRWRRGIRIYNPTMDYDCQSTDPEANPAEEGSDRSSSGSVPPRLHHTNRTFAPERWGQIDRFVTFFSASFPEASSIERRTVSGVGNHFRKALVLKALA